MKNKAIIISLLTLLLVGCSFNKNETKESKARIKAQEEYDSIVADEKFKFWECDQLYTAFLPEADFSGIIWFTSREDYWCLKTISVYASLSSNENTNIYCIDLDKQKSDILYQKAVNQIAEKLAEAKCLNENGEPDFLPSTTIYIKRGQILGISTLANEERDEYYKLNNDDFGQIYFELTEMEKEIYSYRIR